MNDAVPPEQPHPLRVLMVEDSVGDALLLAHELKRGGYAVTYLRVDTPQAMRAALEREPWDVITSDHAMPGFSAPEALEIAQQLNPMTPFIIVSGEMDLNLVVSLMKAGAHDYIQKRELPRVVPSVARELEEVALRRQQQQVLEDLRISEEKFFKAFQYNPDTVVLSRLSDGVYVAVSGAVEWMGGYKPEDLIGKSTLKINLWADPADRARLADVLREKGHFENEEVGLRRKDGSLGAALVSARLIMIRGEPHVIAFTRDITAQKLAEAEIRRQNRELQAISQVISAATTQLDVSAILEETLRGALALTGLESGAIYLLDAAEEKLCLAAAHNLSAEQCIALQDLSIPMSESLRSRLSSPGKVLLFDQRNPADAPLDLLCEACGSMQVIFPLLVKGKLSGLLNLFAGQMVNVPAGSLELAQQLCGAIAISVDNARLYAEVQRHADELEERVAERTNQLITINQELETFSYSVAHDLRAPLRAIDGYSQILTDDYAGLLDAEGQHHLKNIVGAVEHMYQLIDSLLALAKLSRVSLEQKPVDMSTLAHAIAEELQQNEPARQVDWVIADNLSTRGDPNLLRTVLENLLGNAWKFTARRSQARIMFGKQASPGETIYFVQDNGAGFNPEYAHRLFGVFQRLHTGNEFPGTGIGLASVKRIVQRHGGRVWAEGEVNRGATFYFTLK